MRRALFVVMLLMMSMTGAHAQNKVTFGLYDFYINGVTTVGGFKYNIWYRKYSGAAHSRGAVPHKGVTPVTDDGTFWFLEVAEKETGHYLGHITIPSSVNGYGAVASIASGAFKDCGVALTRVDIPSSIGDGILSPACIHSGAFTNCTNIAEIHTAAEVDVVDDAFDDYIYEHTILYVPKGKIQVYKNLTGWKNFKDIREEGAQPGDLNGDNDVNGTDLVALVSIVLGQQSGNSAADVNGDGQVNGTDLVALVNKILNASNARAAASQKRKAEQ